MTEVELHRPRSIDEAVAIAAQRGGDITVLAGGTDVMAAVHAGLLRPRAVLYLGDAGMDGSTADEGQLSIGAMTPLIRLAEGVPGFNGSAAGLAQAARNVGSRAIQVQATVGGHLFARPPYGDLIPVLLVLDARVRVRRTSGERELSLDEFVLGGGQTTLNPGELVTGIVIPSGAGKLGFERLSITQGMGPALLTAAARVDVDERGLCRAASIAVGGAGPRPFRATRAEAILADRVLDEAALHEAGSLAALEAEPTDDRYASAWYRKKVCAVLVERALRAASGGQA